MMNINMDKLPDYAAENFAQRVARAIERWAEDPEKAEAMERRREEKNAKA